MSSSVMVVVSAKLSTFNIQPSTLFVQVGVGPVYGIGVLDIPAGGEAGGLRQRQAFEGREVGRAEHGGGFLCRCGGGGGVAGDVSREDVANIQPGVQTTCCQLGSEVWRECECIGHK